MIRTPLFALSLLLWGFAAACASPESAPAMEPTVLSPALEAEVNTETQTPRGPHVRVVWTRDVGDGTDVISLGNHRRERQRYARVAFVARLSRMTLAGTPAAM